MVCLYTARHHPQLFLKIQAFCARLHEKLVSVCHTVFKDAVF